MIGFHYPASFYLLFAFGFAFALHVWSRWKRKRDLHKMGDWKLLQQLIDVPALVRRRKKEMTALIAFLLLILTAAGPQFGTRLKEVKQRGVDVFIALDTSRSMLAEDVLPSRLDKAKRSLGLLVKKLEGNRIGIIAFAKEAIIQCPLTIDNEAAKMFLEILDDNAVPVQGTSIGDAIRLALKSFPKDEKNGRAIVLLTDGEDHESQPMEAAKEAKEAGVVIFTIGIGTTKGEVIKNRDAQGQVVEFHKYKGEMVVSRMDDAALTKIAMLTGGKFYRASSTDTEIDEIAEILNGFDKKEFATKIHERLQERYQYFALLVFLLLLIEFFIGEKSGQWERLKKISQSRVIPVLILMVILPQILHAADIRDYIRKGNELLLKKDFAGARTQFESARIDAPEEAVIPYNIAATYYLEGNLEDAKKEYEKADLLAKNPDLKSKIAYNWGHLLFSLNERDAAVEKFKQCLRINPHDADAKYNIEYIRSGHTPPPQPQKQDQNKQDQKDGQQDKDNKADQKQGDKDQKNQDKKDQEQNGQEQQKKPGEMSKEDAERILQMLQAQESEKMKNSNPIKVMPKNKNEKKNESTEDW